VNGRTAWTWLLVAAVATSVACAFADSSIVVLALPELYGELGTTIPGISWVITSYNLVVAFGAFLLLPVVRRAGPARLAQVGLLLFLAGCVGCALSSDLATLIAFRVVQGAGGTLLLVATLPLLAVLLGSQARGATMWTFAGTVGAAVGPALGGALTQAFDWRAIFVVQAPIAALALPATLGHRDVLRPERAVGRSRPPLAANVALGLLFGALVGALFLAVLLLVAAWSLSPIEGAAVVSTLPVATVLVRPLSTLLPAWLGVAVGALLLAGGLAGLALLPSRQVVYPACALALCGAGLGLAIPVLSNATVSPAHGLLRSGAWSIGMRHVGLVVALVAVAPLLADDLTRGGERATVGATALIVDARLPLQDKVPLALALRDEFERTPQGQVPDLGAVLVREGAGRDPAVTSLRDDLVGTIESVLTRAFRNAFALSALFALLALAPLAFIARRLA
jgi:MFS family permease